MVFYRIADGTFHRRTRARIALHALRFETLARFTLLAFACLSLRLVRAQDLQLEEPPRTIHGTVVNAVTHAPIPRALVYSLDSRFAMLTDGEGNFEFALPKNEADSRSATPADGLIHFGFSEARSGERLSLSARKPGFLEDQNGNNGASPGSETTISLMPEAVIKGRVSVSAADPAVGITVELFFRQVHEGIPHWTPRGSARANSEGEFRFAELRPGDYKLATHELMDNDPVATTPGSQLYGFPPVYYPGVPDFAAASPIAVTADQTFQADLSLARQPYYPVKIHIANTESIGGMNVSVRGEQGPGYSLGYNSRDQEIEGLLPNGNYVVEAQTFAPKPVTGTVNLKVAGGPAEGPAMSLAEASSISLDVKEEFSDVSWTGETSYFDGQRSLTFRRGPRSYLQARVEAVDDLDHQRGGAIRPPRGPSDNSLVIEDLAPGRYWLRLISARGYVASATVGGVDLFHEPLVVGSGSSIPVEIKLRDDGAELEGTVTNLSETSATPAGSDGGPSTMPAWVYCVPLPDSPGQFQQLGVSADGKFNSPMLTPGAYRIFAFARQQPDLPYRDPEAMRAYDSKGQVVHLAAGQKVTVHVPLISSDQ